jgi:putative membrane protein
MRRLIPALIAVATLFSTSALAQDKASQKFITEAIEGNFAEVQLGELAQKNGQSEEVKTYGKMLVTDHSAANEKARPAATGVGVTSPPNGPNAKQKADYDKMAKLKGAAFDKAFAEHMVKDHQKDIGEYQKASKKQDAVGQYAQATLPTLQKHLDDAKALQKSTSVKR